MPELKEMCKIVKDKTPEEKEYLLCLRAIPNSGESDDWMIVVGRSNAYETIVSMASILDFKNSFVLVETLKLSDRKSLYDFMKYCEQYFDDEFNVDEYLNIETDEYGSLRDVDESLLIGNNERYDPLMDDSVIREDIE